MMFTDKIIVLGITGSIAAYKAVEVASQLTQVGAIVNVIMTKEAVQFISPVTFRAITGRPVVTEMFDLATEFSIEHVSLAEAADIVVIAPATANIIAKMAAGIADDMLCCTVLATKAPVVIVPAMEANMYDNQITQDNLSKLEKRSFVTVSPAWGRLASGKEGLGRLADIDDIIGAICKVLGGNRDLAGKYIVVTAGGTQEPIDPARYISNRSSGKMGYALAEAARDRGAKVTLITAPTPLHVPVGMETINVATAQEMYQAVKNNISGADVLIMAAAVADYRPARAAREKIKKGEAGLTLELELTQDILGSVEGNFIRVGFAAESSELVERAKQKLQEKKLDLIVANDITVAGSGFGADDNQVTIIDREGKIDSLPLLPKQEVADKILNRVITLLAAKDRQDSSILVTMKPAYLKYGYIHIPQRHRTLFPGFKIPFEVETCRGTFQVCINDAFPKQWKQGDMNSCAEIRGLVEWFKTHPQLKKGDVFRIEVVELMKRYCLKREQDYGV